MAEQVELMDGGQVSDGGASQEVAPAEDLDAGQRQPAQAVPDFSKVDLTQLPQFREYQSRADQRLAQLEREAFQAREEARLAKMAGMDDFEKVQFERDDYANRYQSLQQQLVQQQQIQDALTYRNQMLTAISQETGVPINQLDASSPEAAWRSAVKALREKPQATTTTEEAVQEERQPANMVDLGGGSPQTADARYRARLNQLQKQKAPATDIYKLMLGNS